MPEPTKTPAPAATAPALPPELQNEAAILDAKAREAAADAPDVMIAAEQKRVVEEAVKQGADLMFDLTDPLVNQLLLARCPVPEDQYRTLMHSYSAVIEKRWPGAMDNYGPEVAALALTVAIIGPRVIAIRRVEAQEAADAKAGKKQEPADA